jgi:hypothetical protein
MASEADLKILRAHYDPAPDRDGPLKQTRTAPGPPPLPPPSPQPGSAGPRR